MRIDGMKLRSTPSPWFVGTKRRVFTRVSVRLPKYGFRPRRLAMVEPGKKFALPVVGGVVVEMFDGSCVIAAPTFTMPRFSRYEESTTVVGLDVSKSVERRMREPVTVTSSSTWGVFEDCVELDGACCAWTAAEAPSTR